MGEHLKAVEWIDRLPNSGGDWGQGIVGTVRQLEGAIADGEAQKEGLDRKLAELAAEVKAQKALIEAASKTKRKLLKSTVDRANEEAPMMFANIQIARAKGDGEDSASDSATA